MVGFSKTLARYRVSEWSTMYIEYETLKAYVNEAKARAELASPGNTSTEEHFYSNRESMDEGRRNSMEVAWSQYANAPRLITELIEDDKSDKERMALEELWASLSMEYEPTLKVKSALEDAGLGVPDVLQEFYDALDAQANKCNRFYEMLVEMQARALALACKRIDVIDAALNSATPVVSPRESQVEDEDNRHDSAQSSPTTNDNDLVEEKNISAAAMKARSGGHSRAGSLTTISGTDLYALFAEEHDNKDEKSGVKRAAKALVVDSKKGHSAQNFKSREVTVRALLHDVREIYYSVCMIQNFSTLNAVAVRKITKKMDKESRTRTSGIYCTACNELAFWPDLKETTFQCKTMTKLCEDAFLTCHAMLRRIEASKTGLVRFDSKTLHSHTIQRKERIELLGKLRETGKRIKDDGTKVNLERDSVGNPLLFFSGGFFWGLAVPALLIPLWYLVVTCGLESTDARCQRELEAFVTLRGALLVFGQSLLWGPTVYCWQRLSVHWELIFFRTVGKTGLRAEHAILATVLPWLMLVSILMTSTILWSSGRASTEWVGPLTISLFAFFVVPVPSSWKWADDPKLWFIQPPMQTRRFLARHVARTVTAPWRAVVFPDFFIADQLTSQSTAIADLMITFGIASEATSTRAIAATLPQWWRLAQCVRRARDSLVLKRGGSAKAHILNGGKYSLAIVAIWLRFSAATTSSDHTSMRWIIAYLATSVSVLYSLTWDFVMDWTVVSFNRANKWYFEILPRRTLVKSKAAWIIAVVFNIMGRSASLFAAVPGLPLATLSAQALVTGLAGVEVVRRAMWNVFRVENEHSSNVGAFRAAGDSEFDALEDPFVAHVDELASELAYQVPSKGERRV